MSPSTNNTSPEHLASLPYDVIHEIVSHMSVRDVQNLDKVITRGSHVPAKYMKLSDACYDRSSVLFYLNRHFSDGAKLLESMARYAVYISGSRSLEFFDEGHIDDNSDWDFYVHNTPRDVYGFMHELEKLGVTWNTPVDEINELKVAGTGSLTVDMAKLRYLMDKQVLHYPSNDFVELVNRAAGPSAYRFLILFNKDGTDVVSTSRGDSYVSDEIQTIITGNLMYKGKRTRIQLIVETRGGFKLSVVSPFTFHSSCVQSFIGPYTACHMYGELTSSGLSRGWKDNIPSRYKNESTSHHEFAHEDVELYPGWSKYAKRGFKYENPTPSYMDFRLRSTQDCESTWLEYDEGLRVPSFIVRLYTKLTKAISWHELTNTTVPIRFPFSGTHGWNNDWKNWFVDSMVDHVTPENHHILDHLNKYLPYMKHQTNDGRFDEIHADSGAF